jgi:hypothetical protein
MSLGGFGGGRKRCPITGCEERISSGLLMCRRDWFLLPLDLRRLVYRALSRYRKHLDARSLEALRSVQQQAILTANDLRAQLRAG